jgi:GNAT superfamily N-acetyltransferase
MQIRPAISADLEQIMKIIEQARQTMREIGTDQWQYGYPNEAVLAADIAAIQCIVAESDGSILGLAVIKPGPEKGYDQITGSGWLSGADAQYSVVHRLAVTTGSRQQGVARRLIRFAEDQARQKNRPSVRIDTHRGNQPMQRFLEKNGYVCCGLVDIGPGQGDTIRMAFEKMLPACDSQDAKPSTR